MAVKMPGGARYARVRPGGMAIIITEARKRYALELLWPKEDKCATKKWRKIRIFPNVKQANDLTKEIFRGKI
jgi:hypothetical protein